jgi:ribonuclease III
MVHRCTLEPHWGRLLKSDGTLHWLSKLIGRKPQKPELFRQALTHGSASAANYERLEFLGDRVLGLVIGEWLYELFPQEPEGRLSHRLNILVSGEVCAAILRTLEAQPHIVLGKQARDDGAIDSTNVLGDIMEALIGALFLDGGIDDARALIRRLWKERIEDSQTILKHPKSELQEWAAANKRKSPEYKLDDRSGPDHALKFTVTVSIHNVGEASAMGMSKQEAETAAARALLEKIT